MRLLNYFKRKREYNLNDLENHWFGHEFNDWLVESPLALRAIREILRRLDQEDIHFFCESRPVVFLPTNGYYSCAISHSYRIHIVLVLPELMKSFRSANPEESWAILAHELGHIRYKHSDLKVSTLEAQVQADYFAFKCGLGVHLENVLSRTPCLETQTRICYLTSHFAEKMRDEFRARALLPTAP